MQALKTYRIDQFSIKPQGCIDKEDEFIKNKHTRKFNPNDSRTKQTNNNVPEALRKKPAKGICAYFRMETNSF